MNMAKSKINTRDLSMLAVSCRQSKSAATRAAAERVAGMLAVAGQPDSDTALHLDVRDVELLAATAQYSLRSIVRKAAQRMTDAISSVRADFAANPAAAADLGSCTPPAVQAVLDNPPSYISAGITEIALRRWAADQWRASMLGGHGRYDQLLSAFGFDGVCVLEADPSLDGGGNQLCVFDPSAVRIVN
jgi:hypothetical protein